MPAFLAEMNHPTLRRVGALALMFVASSSLLGAQCLKKKTGGDADAGAVASASATAEPSATAAPSADPTTAAGGEDAQATAQTGTDDAGASSSGGGSSTGMVTLDAVNANKIGRYKDESKIDGETAKLLQGGIVRSFPSTGEFVTFLGTGAEVTKVASRQDAFLVTFANPKKPSEKLAGWVDGSAFKALPDAGPPKTVTCKLDKDCKSPGQVCVLTGLGRSIETCVTPCRATPPACGPTQECSGESVRPGGEFVAFCQPAKAKPDAGAATPDAGPAVAFKVGDKVSVLWQGSWYPATIIAQKGALFRIHYDGYGNEWDEDVGTARIRRR